MPALKREIIPASKDPQTDIIASVKNFLVKNRFEVIRKTEKPKSLSNVIFLLDASGSMAVNSQMAYVKGIIDKTIKGARGRKASYAIVALADGKANLVQSFTSNIRQISELNYSFKTRGKTNLGEAFLKVGELIKGIDKSTVRLFIFTDGKANSGPEGISPFNFAVNSYKKYIGQAVNSTVIDTEKGVVRLGKSKELADKLKLNYHRF